MKPMLNFFVQSQNVTAFRHSYLQKLAESFGAKCKNFTPDSCDMIFPNKEAFEEFENARKHVKPEDSQND
jgi:hypothetical protein